MCIYIHNYFEDKFFYINYISNLLVLQDELINNYNLDNM